MSQYPENRSDQDWPPNLSESSKFSEEAEEHLDQLDKKPIKTVNSELPKHTCTQPVFGYPHGKSFDCKACNMSVLKPKCKKCHGEGRVRSVACDHEGCYGDCGRTIECSKCGGHW